MKRTDLIWLIPTGIGLGALLSALSPGTFLPGWLAFSALALVSLVLLRASQRLVNGGKSLGWILAVAFALRLGLGLGAFVLEPRIGYDNEVNKAGYLFTDAFNRDNQAWDLAISANPLTSAFDEKLVSDQYGGMLFLSALTYRSLSPDAHRPLLVTLLAALAGALGAAFVWGAGKRLDGAASTDAADETHKNKNLRKSTLAGTRAKSVDKNLFKLNLPTIAALIFAFFPEAILLGAAQMREPFLMTLIAMAFYGLVEWQTSRARLPWLWMGLALLGMLFISPGFILVTLIGAAGWLYFSQNGRRIPWQAVVGALLVFAVAFVMLSLSWGNLVAAKGGGLGVIGDWARETVKWNRKIIESSSGIIQLLFQNFPRSFQLPFIAIYGLLQPVLPAVIFEPSVPFWQILGTIRAIGWYAMLPFLAYAPFAKTDKRWLWLSIFMIVWALVASLRGGADQWDNPRYRVILLGWQALVVAQTFLSLKQAQGRWFFRILMVEAVLLLVFSHWYMFRYLSIGFNIGIRNTLAIAIGGSILLVFGDWLIEKVKTRTKP